MWSPAETVRSSWTGDAGSSSYHAVWVALPLASQSTAVPACSSALDPLSPAPEPPSPTQNEAWPDEAEQLADGSVQLPATRLKPFASWVAGSWTEPSAN